MEPALYAFTGLNSIKHVAQDQKAQACLGVHTGQTVRLSVGHVSTNGVRTNKPTHANQ